MASFRQRLRSCTRPIGARQDSGARSPGHSCGQLREHHGPTLNHLLPSAFTFVSAVVEDAPHTTQTHLSSSPTCPHLRQVATFSQNPLESSRIFQNLPFILVGRSNGCEPGGCVGSVFRCGTGCLGAWWLCAYPDKSNRSLFRAPV